MSSKSLTTVIKSSPSSTFSNVGENHPNRESVAKRVDRTIKISALTKGIPLRRPHAKNGEENVSNSVSSILKNNVNILENNGHSACGPSVPEGGLLKNNYNMKKEPKSPNFDNTLDQANKPGLKTTILDQFITKKEFPDFSCSTSSAYSEENFSLYSEKSSPAERKPVPIKNIKHKISYPGEGVKFPSKKSSLHHDRDSLMDGDIDDMDSEYEWVVNEATVKFVKDNLIAKVEFAFTGDEEVRFDHPIGVSQLKNKQIVVADTFADRMHLFSEDGHFVRDFGSNSVLKQPSAIAVLPDGRFAVRNSRDLTMFSSKCVYLFSIGADYLRKPFGIASDCDGNLMTIDTGLGDTMHIIRIDSNTGDLIRKVPVTGAVPHSLLPMSKPRFIAFRPPSTLLVVDLGLNKVYIVNLNSGKVLKSFGKSGSRDGEFNDPSGIACDADGFILIGDSRNHRIQIFTPNGDFVSILRVDRQLKRPSGLYLSPEGHLLVLNYWENSLVKYKFLSSKQ